MEEGSKQGSQAAMPGQLHAHGSFLGSRDFETQSEASPDGPAEERLKKKAKEQAVVSSLAL